jgi:hypothetical protein
MRTVESWIDKYERSSARVYDRVKPRVVDAIPIVARLAALSTGIAAIDHATALGRVAVYLRSISIDAGKIAGFVSANTGLPVNVVLHNAAVFALSSGIAPTESILVSDLDLAVQIGYSAWKETKSSE